jgi:flagellar biosynthesis GTPase FlhF
MSEMSETTTYRGNSLEELLPQIREELGPDAVIVRQREGIVGGVGGFFGKKCIEVEARPAPRAAFEAYDTGDDELSSEPLLDALMAQTSPFVEQLSDALARRPELEVVERPQPVVTMDLDLRPPATPVRVEAGDEVPDVLAALAAAGIPAAVAEAIMDEVEHSLRPFEPHMPRRELARRALARRVKVAHMSRAKRRKIAVVGPPGAGRTLAAAKLSHAHMRAGRSVTALSLEPVRSVERLNELTRGSGIDLEVADTYEKLELVKPELRSDVVVVDTPAIADPTDEAALAPTLEMLELLRPEEMHLLLAAGSNARAVTRYVDALAQHLTPSRILITHADLRPHTGVPVGMSLAAKIPVSFVAEGTNPAAGLTPAEPEPLARMVLA